MEGGREGCVGRNGRGRGQRVLLYLAATLTNVSMSGESVTVGGKKQRDQIRVLTKLSKRLITGLMLIIDDITYATASL